MQPRVPNFAAAELFLNIYVLQVAALTLFHDIQKASWDFVFIGLYSW